MIGNSYVLFDKEECDISSKLSVIPRFWERLTIEDQKKYVFLHKTMSSPNYKNKRHKSNQMFQKIINTIKAFVIRGEIQDYDRSLVCGIFFLKEMKNCNAEEAVKMLGTLKNEIIITNTNQLKILLSKSKSSINGSLQTLGYNSVTLNENGDILAAADDSQPSIVSRLLPEFENNYSITRQWTVRSKSSDWVTPPVCKLKKKKKDGNQNFGTPPPDHSIFPVVISMTLSVSDNSETQSCEASLQSLVEKEEMKENVLYETDEVSNIGFLAFETDEDPNDESDIVF
jgi:hypothetical protein